MAEAAIERWRKFTLGAVGAYYHDVGKLKDRILLKTKAYKNIHDDLEPSLSALVIASHVKEGVEMARSINCKICCNIINQHHGTGLISYFYHRALQSNGINLMK